MTLRRRLATFAAATALCIGASSIAAGTAQANTHAPNIYEGQSGFAVYCVQWGLDYGAATDWGRDYAPYGGMHIDTDGSFGPKTLAMVKAFQNDPGFGGYLQPADGIVGPRTGWQLIRLTIGEALFNNGDFTTPYGVPFSHCEDVIPSEV